MKHTPICTRIDWSKPSTGWCPPLLSGPNHGYLFFPWGCVIWYLYLAMSCLLWIHCGKFHKCNVQKEQCSHMHERMDAHIQSRIHMHASTCTTHPTHTHTDTDTHEHPPTHTYTHTQTNTHMHTHAHRHYWAQKLWRYGISCGMYTPVGVFVNPIT